MTPLQGHLAKASLGVCILSGLALFWMRSWLEAPEDPLALVNHAQEPLAQALHVASSWAAVFAVGALFWSHALPYLTAGQRQRRRSGQALVWSFLPMAASGVGLQLASDAAQRAACLWAHWVASLLFALAFGVHLLLPKLAQRRRRG
jgi:hypothetical protein